MNNAARHHPLFALILAGLLCGSLLTSTAAAQPVAGDRGTAVDLVTRDLGGTLDGVRLWIDAAPLSTGQTVATWHHEVFAAKADGWLVFVDRYPGANWEHPCWYYFVDRETGSLERHDATTPPNRLASLDEITDGRDNPPAGASEAALEAYSERLRALPRPARSRDQDWALIISGGANSGSNHVRYWNDCAFIYRTLVEYYGYADDQIRVLISDGTDPAADRSDGTNSPADLDGDGDPDIEYPATHTYIGQVFDELSAALDAEDQLFIFTTDHGGQESGQDCYLNLWNNEVLRDDNLAAYIDGLPCETVICTFEQCFSGGMVDDIEGEGRVIATAADWDEYSYAMGPDYIYNTFAYFWTSAVGFSEPDGTPVNADTNDDGIVSMHEAFVYAEANDMEDETPQYSSTPLQLGYVLNLFGSLSGVLLTIDDVIVDDDAEGASSGDGDGIIEYGETIELSVALYNMGQSDAVNVLGTLASTSAYVTVDVAAASYGFIASEGTVTAGEPFVFTVAWNIPDGADLELTLGTNEIPGALPLTLIAAAPVYAVSVYGIDDTVDGDSDGMADPGESVALDLAIANTGSSPSPDLEVLLRSTALCQSDEVARSCATIPVGESLVVGGFGVTIDPACPPIHLETMAVELSGPGDHGVDTETHLTIGPWFDTAEQDLGWTLGLAGDTATAGQWERVDPVGTTYGGEQIQPEDDHTEDPGTLCFVTANGPVGGGYGDADVDGGYTTLLSPVFDVADATSATLNYWRWYSNSFGHVQGDDVWRVEVTTDGETWISLESTDESANTWTEMTFDLGAYIELGGTMQFRFVADDAGTGSLVEAAVDDIMVTIVRSPVTATPDQAAATLTVLNPCEPNPLSSVTTVSFRLAQEMPATIELYDLKGRRVRTVHAGTLAQGAHRLSFDAVDDQRRRLPAGVYFVRMHTPEATQVRQVTVIR